MKCTLQIKDEVNVQFRDLDPKTRRKLNQAVEYFLPHAYYMPAYKLGRWNGKVSFCDVAGRTYFQLLEKLLPIVVAEGYEISIEDHRHGWEFDFEHVEQTSYDHVMWPPRHPHAGEPISSCATIKSMRSTASWTILNVSRRSQQELVRLLLQQYSVKR